MKKFGLSKMDLLKNLLNLNPEIKSIDQQPICDLVGRVIGWNCYFMNHKGQAIAGGTASNVELAKRIAVAECYERALFNKFIQDTEVSEKLLLNESPSTSGFAAGFDKNSTAFRSICEAVERWAWSKWIDEGFFIPQIQQPQVTELSKGLASNFTSTSFLHLPIKVERPFFQNLTISIFLGFKGEGVFAGSRATSTNDNPWEHAIIEAYRNLKNFDLGDRSQVSQDDIIGQRALYFGDRAGEALSQIKRASKKDWPVASMKIHREVPTGVDSLYLFRSMCNDFKHWHLGDEKRFVY